jgi:antitoxin ParD1/3/4
MPTRNVNLTPELDSFIASRVASGHFADDSEVVSAALRLLEREESEYDEKMAILRAAIDAGDASPDAGPGIFDQIREKYGLVWKEA